MERYLLALVLLVWPSVSLAGVVPKTCDIYYSDDQNVPSQVQEIRSLSRAGAVKICSIDAQENSEWHMVLSPPTRGILSACQYVERNVFQEDRQGAGSTWTYSAPKDQPYLERSVVYMMMKPDSICPKQGDGKYILTSGISEGVFVSSVQFWEQLVATGNLDAALFDTSSPNKLTEGYITLAATLKNGLIRPIAARLQAIKLAENSTQSDGQHYVLEVLGSPKSWSLLVDFVGSEMRLLKVLTAEY